MITKIYKPSIEERETGDLIEIANSDISIWESGVIEQAKTELAKRMISKEYQNNFMDNQNAIAKKHFQKRSHEIELNKLKVYKLWQILLFYIFAPILFIRPRGCGVRSLIELKRENYLSMFKQRIIIYFFSFVTYAFCITYYIYWKERKWQREIEKIDISDWKNKNDIK